MSDHQENGTGGGRNAPTLNQDEFVRRVFGVDVIMRRRAGGLTGVMGGTRRQAYAQASATLLEAEHVRVASPMLPGAIGQYAGLLETMRTAEQNQNWDGALAALQQAVPLARKLLIVQQRRVQAPQEKLVFQLEQYNEIAPILQRVRKSYFPSGGAENLRESDLSAGRQFKDYIEAVAGLEQAKSGVLGREHRVRRERQQQGEELHLQADQSRIAGYDAGSHA